MSVLRIYTIVLLFLYSCVNGQTGTVGDPFVSLNQAASITTAGVYYFNIGGTTFDTYVDANGYVQIAIDFGNGVGNLPQSTSLNTSSRGILTPGVLSSLTEILEVRISSSTNNIDVVTNNSTIISRVQNNMTLHGGALDNTINNNWTGTNAARFTVNASCNTSGGTSLNRNIVHVCGSTVSFNWLPGLAYQRELWSSGEVASTVSFHLWVKGNPSCSKPTITSLAQAAFIKIPGIYCFDIGGTKFDTYVDANGYVQIAIDFGNGAGNLPQSTSLNTSSRGILTPSVLSSLTETGEVRVSISTGNIDVVTTNSTIVSRIINNQTLHKGSVDNTVNDMWTGINSAYLTRNASCSSTHGTSLNQNIFHPCGNTNTLHWMPSNSQQRELHATGEILNSEFIQIWVRENSSPLPIRLLKFSAYETSEETVRLEWETASEINNDYFIIERSIDGENWEEVLRKQGAINSNHIISYEGIDKKPYLGLSYYRLKQVDLDGKYTYSNIEAVNIFPYELGEINVYPNPSKGIVTIQGDDFEIVDYELYDLLGSDVTNEVKMILSQGDKVVIDISSLPKGVYFIKTKTNLSKIVKH